MQRSIIIPTMWVCPNELKTMLTRYEKSKYIKEVIIIDNNPSESESLSEFKKIRHFPQETNIFVNPAWNLGVKLANYEPIIANDDIDWIEVDYLIEEVNKKEYDLVGASLYNCHVNSLVIHPIKKWYGNSYGSLMFIKDYKPIPDQLKIFRGDKWLFDNAKNPATFSGIWFTNKSSTVNILSDEIYSITKNDELIYNNLMKNKI